MNTYVISNTKASLQLQQDLNLMAVGWLVVFSCSAGQCDFNWVSTS
jgi:hypothetical protein